MMMAWFNGSCRSGQRVTQGSVPTIGIALCMFGTQLVACGGPQLGRTGPAQSLPNGPPRTSCERGDWHELVPARVKSTVMTAGVGYNTVYTKTHEGLGVFSLGDDEPEKLEDLWPRLSEPRLQQQHQSRIRPVDDASKRSLYWALGGLAGMVGGVGLAAAMSKDSPEAAGAFGVTGLVVGLVGVVGALVTQPSGHDQLEAEARRRLFIPGEDDMVAVARGVNRVNGSQRKHCGGQPTPFSNPQPPPGPRTQMAISPAARATTTTEPPTPPLGVAGSNASPPGTSAPPTSTQPKDTDDAPW